MTRAAAEAAPAPRGLGERAVAGALLALALLHVVPIWAAPYLPTTDGGAHVYNAWILRGLLSGDAPSAIAEHYELNLRPYPNWLGHAAMAALMGVAPPPVAEKLLATAYVLLFAAGSWTLLAAVREREPWIALLALPFIHNRLFQFGFYNYALGLALVPWVLGHWWRHRERPTPAFALRLNLLLFACWFAHLMPFALAIAGVGVLWATTLRGVGRRARLAHVAILLPQAALPLWYLADSQGRADGSWDTLQSLRYLGTLEALTVDTAQRPLVLALSAGFLVLLLRTLWVRGAPGAPRRPADVFLLLAGLALLAYLLAPTHLAGGGLVKERLSLLPFLAVIPALVTGWRPAAQRAAAVVLVGLVLVDLALVVRWSRERGREVARFVAGLEAAPRGSRVVSVLYDRRPLVESLKHATGHAAVRRGLVDWDNYEAKARFFPTRFRGSIEPPRITRQRRASAERLVARHRAVLDAVYTWRMPPGHPERVALRRHYRRVSGEPGGGELWVRRRRPWYPRRPAQGGPAQGGPAQEGRARGMPLRNGDRARAGAADSAPRADAPPTAPSPSAGATPR